MTRKMERYKSRAFITAIVLLAVQTSAEELTLSVNFKRPISVTSERFLSLTVDPFDLLHSGDVLGTNFEKSTNIARALAPAYIRFGGPHSNVHESDLRQNHRHQQNLIFSEPSWILLHQWAEKAGLDVIACIPAEYIEAKRPADTEDATEIVSLSDRMGYNSSWQLGYECQGRCNVSASDLGRRALELRRILEEFPRYSGSIVTGPDFTDYRTKEQQEYVQDYLSIAATALSAITWHPNFAGVTLDDEGVSMHYDNLAMDKDDLYKVIGRFAAKRPLWIAESKPEECKNQFLGALVWARRLGNAAKLRIEVLMRQPSVLDRPTPDFWVSVLHKMLVGREVFDTKVQVSNKRHVYFYCHCTRPTAEYAKGSITVFGINLTPNDVLVNLKGNKITSALQYILLPGFDAPNRMFSESVLLNNETLNLINDTYVPDIRPKILNDSNGVDLNLPSGGIGFWVLPDLKVKSCMDNAEDTGEKILLKRFQKRMVNIDVPEPDGDEYQEKSFATRSVDDPDSLSKRIRNRQKNAENKRPSRRLRKSDIRREMRRLQKFLKKKSESYEGAFLRPQNLRRSSGILSDQRRDDDTPGNTKNFDSTFQTLQDIGTKLKEYKDRLSDSQRTSNDSKTENEDIQNEAAQKAISLISMIGDTLDTVKDKSIDYTRKADVSTSVKEHLKSLYSLLTRTSLGETNDTSESEEDKPVDGTTRSKRELDKRVTEDPLGIRRENLPKKRPRIEEVKDRRIERKLKIKDNAKRDVIRPSVLEPRVGDNSGENNFYGFFRREPSKGFPEGDVFLVTGDSSQNDDYDYVKDEDEPSEQQPRTSQRVKVATDYVDTEDMWVEDDNDYHGYAPNEFFENVKMPAYRIKENLKDYADLWDAENRGNRGKDGAENSEEEDAEDCPLEESQEAPGDKKQLEKVNGYYDEAKDPRARRRDENQEARTESSVKSAPRTRHAPRSNYENRQTSSGKNGWARTKEEKSKGADENVEFSAPLKNGRTGTSEQLKTRMANEDEYFSDYNVNRFSKNADFSITGHDGIRANKRPKRKNEELNTLFDQEMIKEDDDNSKDCRCRVIRDSKESSPPCPRCKRDTLQVPVTEATESLPLQETSVRSNVRTAEDIETNDESSRIERDSAEKTLHYVENEEGSSSSQESVPDHFEEYEKTSEDPETRKSDDLTSTENSSDFSLNSQHLTPETTTEMSSDTVPPAEDGSSFLEASTSHPREDDFFREAVTTDEETTAASDTAEDTAEHGSNNGEDTTSTAEENDAQESTTYTSPQTEGLDGVSRSESFGTTFRPAVSTEEVTKQPDGDYNNDKATTGTWKRQVSARQAEAEKFIGNKGTTESANVEAPRETGENKRVRASSSTRSKGRSNERAEARESRLSARTKALLALRKENDSKRGRKIMVIPPRPGSIEENRHQEYQKKRAEQIERLKERLREKREKLFQQYHEQVLDIVREINDEEMRNLKRREAWEKMKDSDDFRKMIDQEKLAYILMYKPVNYRSIKEEEKNDGSNDERRVPAVELVRETNLRERLTSPRNHRDSRDSTIMRCSDPRRFAQKIRVQDMREDDAVGRNGRNNEGNRGIGRSYYAIVENLNNPRIIKYQQNLQEQRKRSAQVPATVAYVVKNGQTYTRPQVKRYLGNNNYQNVLRESKESGEDPEGPSNRLSLGRRLYVIDPSTYRGGEPILQVHEEPLKSTKSNLKTVPEDFYRTASKSPSDESYRSNSAEEEDNLESTYGELPGAQIRGSNSDLKKVYMLNNPKFQNLPKKCSDGQFLKILMSPVDPRNMKEVIDKLMEPKDPSSNETQSSRNPNDDQPSEVLVSAKNPGIEETNGHTEVPKQIFEHGGAVEEKQPSEARVTTPDAVAQAESYRSTAEQEEAKLKDDINPEVQALKENADSGSSPGAKLNETKAINVRGRRSTDSRPRDERLKRLPSFLGRKVPRGVRRSARHNYLCLKEDSRESSLEDSSKIFKILKQGDHYKAVPVGSSKNRLAHSRKNVDPTASRNFENYARLMELERSNDDSTNDGASEESNDYEHPSDEDPRDLIVGAKDPYATEELLEDGSGQTEEEMEGRALIKSNIDPGDFSVESMEEDPPEILHVHSAEVGFDPRAAGEAYGANSDEDEYRVNLEDVLDSDKHGILMLLPWRKERLGRLRRHVEDQPKRNDNRDIDETESRELQELEGVPSSSLFISSNIIDDIDESIVRKKPTEYSLEGNINKAYSSRKNGLPSFIEESIPKMEDIIVDGFEKAQNLTESVEQLIEDIDEKYNETSKTEGRKDSFDGVPISARDVFRSAIMNVKKLFSFLGGFARILRG